MLREAGKCLSTEQLFTQAAPVSKPSQSKMILQVIYPFATSGLEMA